RSGWYRAFMTRGTRKSSPYSTTNVSWSVVRTVGEKVLVSCDVTVVDSTHLIFAIFTPSHEAHRWWRGVVAGSTLRCPAVGGSSMLGGMHVQAPQSASHAPAAVLQAAGRH